MKQRGVGGEIRYLIRESESVGSEQSLRQAEATDFFFEFFCGGICVEKDRNPMALTVKQADECIQIHFFIATDMLRHNRDVHNESACI
jgi:hypothetical protein